MSRFVKAFQMRYRCASIIWLHDGCGWMLSLVLRDIATAEQEAIQDILPLRNPLAQVPSRFKPSWAGSLSSFQSPRFSGSLVGYSDITLQWFPDTYCSWFTLTPLVVAFSEFDCLVS